jgi:hypothetical protein
MPHVDTLLINTAPRVPASSPTAVNVRFVIAMIACVLAQRACCLDRCPARLSRDRPR